VKSVAFTVLTLAGVCGKVKVVIIFMVFLLMYRKRVFISMYKRRGYFIVSKRNETPA
jgi:hypothetical protein